MIKLFLLSLPAYMIFRKLMNKLDRARHPIRTIIQEKKHELTIDAMDRGGWYDNE